MQSLWFWTNWLKEYRWIWFLSASLLILSFAFYWFTYFQQANGVIHWERIQEQKVLESTVHSFNVGPFSLSIPAENYVIIEYFNGSAIAINEVTSIIFVVVIALCAILLVSVITTLPRFWYIVGMGLFIVFVVSLRIEVLAIFFQRNQIPTIAILGVYTLVSYYFHALRPSVFFINRVIVFSAVTLIVSFFMYLFSGVQYPGLHLAVTAYVPGLVLTVFFILMVAHEIPAFFVYVASQGNSKSLRHFSVITSVYLLYVIITCLHELHVIQWNFVYVNAYLLFFISAILGVWGFKQRESLYSGIITFAPFGAYFYAALAVISFITIGQFFGTSNDPALHIIKRVIIFSHVGYGVIFLTYVFSNFILMLANNMAVYKVLYKPNRMPYFTYRFAGLIATLAFIFYSSWSQYVYKGIAGFYNNIADLYVLLDRPGIAEAYYEQGRNYGFENNHANYALASMKTDRLDHEDAHRNYELANGGNPTDFSLVNEGNLYLWENNFFESIKTYHRGLKKIKSSGELENNLGSAYGRIHNIDSALVFLNKARRHSNSRSSAETNFFAIAALEYLPVNCDSVLKIFDSPSEATRSNAIVLANMQNQKFNTTIDIAVGSRLTLYSATLLSNYIVRNAKTLDSSFIHTAYKVASDSLNSDYSEALKSSIAFGYYHLGNVSQALKVLAELVYISQSHQGKFNYIMGLWALEQNNPVLSASYFNYSVEANYKEGKLYHAIALTEAQKVKEAVVAWDSVGKSDDEAQQQMAAVMKRLLKMDVSEVYELPDDEKYQFCRYRLNTSDTAIFKKIVTTFGADDYKAQALLDMTRRLHEWGDMTSAINFFTRVSGLKLTDSVLYEEIKHMELLMLAERGELRTLAKQLNKGVSFEENKTVEKLYYTTLLKEASGDTINIDKNFEMLGSYNPYFEQGVIAAANYFRKRYPTSMKSYSILVEAIHVNNNSVKLLKAYSAEAKRMGFPEYAVSVDDRIAQLYKEEHK